MTAPSRQIGEGPQITWLRYILNQLVRLTGIASKIATNPSIQLTSDQVEAIQNATSPSITNVFATIVDVPTTLSELSDDSTHRVVTDIQIGLWTNTKQYTIYLEPSTTTHVRVGVRNGIPVTDVELTSTGFAGTQDVDWECIIGV